MLEYLLNGQTRALSDVMDGRTCPSVRRRDNPGRSPASVRTAEGREGEGRRCVRVDALVSARTRFLPRRRTVKTRPRVKPRPWGKRGRGRTSGRKGRPDGNFPPKSSFMTSLLESMKQFYKQYLRATIASII
jgi:hypothetical protein